MANPEHEEVVIRGFGAIYEWRYKNKDTKFDLSYANLHGTNLMGINLQGANLVEANLQGADLDGANLQGADLEGANLEGADLEETNFQGAYLMEALLIGAFLRNADLSGAHLQDANLTEANLEGANLHGTYLQRANFQSAYLKETDLTEAHLEEADLQSAFLIGTYLKRANFLGAICGDTFFGDVDLSEAIGLETVMHNYPSTIGENSLFKSKGKIPREFLLGAGVHDSLIKYLPDLIGALKPIQFYSCFLSHSSKDERFCKRLFSRLRDEQLRIWYAPEELKGGELLIDQITKAIRVYDKLLLVLSENSIHSKWVETEILNARKKERESNKRILFPIRLITIDQLKKWTCFDSDTGEDLAIEVRKYFIPDFSNWKDHDNFEISFKRLLDDLRSEEPLKIK